MRNVGQTAASESSFKVARDWFSQCLVHSGEALDNKYAQMKPYLRLPLVEVDYAWSVEKFCFENTA